MSALLLSFLSLSLFFSFSVFSLIPVASAGSPFQSALQKAPGEVGCTVSVFQQSNPKCDPVKDALREATKSFLKDQNEFQSTLLGELKSIRGRESYAYLPILIAAWSENPAFKSELKRISELESKEKFKFTYANQALQRWEPKGCTRGIHPYYNELCFHTDSTLARLFQRARVKKEVD